MNQFKSLLCHEPALGKLQGLQYGDSSTDLSSRVVAGFTEIMDANTWNALKCKILLVFNITAAGIHALSVPASSNIQGRGQGEGKKNKRHAPPLDSTRMGAGIRENGV